MKKKLSKYDVFPSVVMAGRKSDIRITPKRKKHNFNEDEYILTVCPTEIKDIKKDENYILDNVFNQVVVPVKDGALSLKYDFRHEQEYGIIVETKEKRKVLECAIYALAPDLYGTLPYKGDLHFHSVKSDGDGELPEIAGALREQGYDFLCLTDHHRFYPSEELKSMYENVNTGLKIFLGEEVHNMDNGYFHIVNFNGKYSVNSLIAKDYEGLKRQIFEEAEKLELPQEIDPAEYVFRKWICDQIRKSGGLAIFPHPYWRRRGTTYHTETPMAKYTIKQGLYDVFEVLNGCLGTKENNLQVALYQELRAEGFDIPVVGSSDSHGTDCDVSGFDHSYTLVFANDVEGVPQAILDKKSVAVENVPNETPRVYGTFRMVKYALFLIENFYPEYMALTQKLGDLICAYGETKKCAEDIERISKTITEFRNHYFGVE